MKFAFIPLAILASTSVFAQLPLQLATFKTDEGNDVVLTSRQAHCEKGKRSTYIRSPGGQLLTTGCYFTTETSVWVTWDDDGTTFEYPGRILQFTPEFKEWELRNGQGGKP